MCPVQKANENPKAEPALREPMSKPCPHMSTKVVRSIFGITMTPARDPKQFLFNHLKNRGREHRKEESWRMKLLNYLEMFWHVMESLKCFERFEICWIMLKLCNIWNLLKPFEFVCDSLNSYEIFWILGAIRDASGKHLGGIWEASGNHMGVILGDLSGRSG